MNAEPATGRLCRLLAQGRVREAGTRFEPYVQDALDEIEYITGSPTSKWGALRAKAGHPQPFPLNYVEVGNEDFFDRVRSYDERFAQFRAAIKARYPRLLVISSVGFEQPEARRVRSITPDVVDEHYYRTVDTFLKMARGHYESYDRRGPKISPANGAHTRRRSSRGTPARAARRRHRTCGRQSAMPPG